MKKNLGLFQAAKLSQISPSRMSKLETGITKVAWDVRDKIMTAYGYNPSSFKNFSKDPVRSKAVPISFKLDILLKHVSGDQIAQVFQHLLRSPRPRYSALFLRVTHAASQ